MRRPSLRRRSALWRDSGFVRLWAANGVSELGTQVTLLALPLTIDPARKVISTASGRDLIAVLGQTGRLQLAFGAPLTARLAIRF